MPTITPALRDALQSIFDRALHDYEAYRSSTDKATFETDYPDSTYAEWVAAREAEFELVGDFLEEIKL